MQPEPEPEPELPTGQPDGMMQIAESTWAVFGQSAYDGAVILAEYHDCYEAWAVANPRRRSPDQDPSTDVADPDGTDQ